MELGGPWHEMYAAPQPPPPGSAPPPAPAEYNLPQHLYSPESAYHRPPPPLPTTTQYHYPLRPISSSSYYYPDPNPNYAAVSAVPESNTLFRYQPIDRPSPPLRYYSSLSSYPLDRPSPALRSYSSIGGYCDGYRPAPYEFAAGGPPPASLSAACVGRSELSSYYGGGRRDEPYNFNMKETILQYGVDPSRYAANIPRATIQQDLMALGPKSTSRQNFRPHPASKVIAKGGKAGQKMVKSGKKITKVVRSAYCEVCKVQCDTEEVLKLHKQGKKHKGNLEKLKESITAKPVPGTNSQIMKEPASDKDKAAAERIKRIDIPATAEELEAKKRRVLEGGAAADGVMVCNICNVVVNSAKVFEYHVQGQKHAAMVKQQQEQLNAPVKVEA